MTQTQKEALDEFEFSRAMKDVNKGLYLMTQVMRKQGVIIDHNRQYS